MKPKSVKPLFEVIENFNINHNYAKIMGVPYLEGIEWSVSVDYNSCINLSGKTILTNDILSLEKLHILKPFDLTIGNKTYYVEEGYATIWDDSKEISEECELKIAIKKIIRASVEANNQQYFKIIVPIKDRLNWHRGINMLGYRFNDVPFSSSACLLNIHNASIFLSDLQYNNEKYIVFATETPITYEEMKNSYQSILLAFSMFSSILPLEYYICLSSSTENFSQGIEFYSYEKLQPTICSQYDIFTAMPNGFKEVLIANKAEYCIEQIDSLRHNNSLKLLDIQIIENLSNNLYIDDTLQRAIYMILEAPQMAIDHQAIILFCALESICKTMDKPIVDNKIWNEEILPKLEETIHNIPQDILLPDASEKIIAKIGSCNHIPNGDKLKLPFNEVGYDMTQIDLNAVNSLRNKYLHGKVSGKTFEEQYYRIRHDSLSAHKLCCVLILLRAGFKGYIINNLVLHGFKEEIANKEPLFIQIPNC